MDSKWLNNISGRRIEQIVKDIAHFSRGPKGGRIAYAFSQVEDNLFRYVKNWVYQLNSTYTFLNRNLDFYEDAIGNLYITLDSDREYYVSCGSHLDSVINGGNYDGVLGVAAGLEVLRALYEREVQAKHGFCLIVFRCEESVATGMPCLGSAVATGQISREKLENLEYRMNGKTSLKNYLISKKKFEWDKILKLVDHKFVILDRYKCFLELHIEQGVLLERAGEKVGVVKTGIAGGVKWDVLFPLRRVKHTLSVDEAVVDLEVSGRRDHSGGTPMNGVNEEVYRDDALVKSVKVLRFLEEKGILRGVLDWEASYGHYSVISGTVYLRLVLVRGWEKVVKGIQGVNVDKALAENLAVDSSYEMLWIWANDLVSNIGRMILYVEKEAKKQAVRTDGLICGTVGRIEKKGENVKLMFDLRFLDEMAGEEILNGLKEFLVEVGAVYREISCLKPAFFDEKIVSALADVHKQIFGRPAFLLPSMPGHDSRNMANSGIPTGMIFVPCREGVSHSTREYASPEVMEAGARLLGAGLMQFAQE